MSGKEERKWWRESKELAWGARNWPSVTVTTAETHRAERYETRRGDTQDSTSRNIMLFSILYQSPYLLLPGKHIIFHPFICPCSLQCWAAA